MAENYVLYTDSACDIHPDKLAEIFSIHFIIYRKTGVSEISFFQPVLPAVLQTDANIGTMVFKCLYSDHAGSSFRKAQRSMSLLEHPRRPILASLHPPFKVIMIFPVVSSQKAPSTQP